MDCSLGGAEIFKLVSEVLTVVETFISRHHPALGEERFLTPALLLKIKTHQLDITVLLTFPILHKKLDGREGVVKGSSIRRLYQDLL